MTATCPMHGEAETFTAPFAGYIKEPGCTCSVLSTAPSLMTASTDLDDTLANIRARAEAATPGPWEVVSDQHRGFAMPEVSVWSSAAGVYVTEDVVTRDNSQFPANAEFIAHARTDVELLLTLLDEQRAVIARVRALADEWKRAAAKPRPEQAENETDRTDGVRLGVWHSVRTAAGELQDALDGADTTTTDGSET